MMMKTWRFWLFAFGLGMIALVLLLLVVGPMPLRGIDEWVIPGTVETSLGFNNAVKALAEIHRPIQSIMHALIYYIFDLHDVYRPISVLLHLLNIAAFVAVVRRAFPQGDRIALIAGLMMFFIPVNTVLFFNFSFDTPRLSMIYYWLAVYALQSWILRSKPLAPVLWVEIAIALITASLLTYENALMLAPVTLGFVWATARTQGLALSSRQTLYLWLRVTVAVTTAYGLWWFIRWFLGAELHSSVVSSFSNFIPNLVYVFNTLWYWPLEWTLPIVLIGVITGLVVGWLIWTSSRIPHTATPTEPRYWRVMALGIGVGLWFFGYAPYGLTVAFPMLNITLQSPLRAYSSSIFGIVLLVGLIATLRFPRWVQIGLAVFFTVFVAIQQSFIFSLATRYRVVADDRRSLFRDLATLVPNVAPEARIILINGFLTEDPDMYVPERGLVVGSLNVYIMNILYEPTTPPPLYLFDNERGTTPELRTRFMQVISANGLSGGPSLDQLIILRREGNHLVLVDTLTPADTEGLIVEWRDGITEIHTNPAMIVHDRDLVGELVSRGLLFPQP